MYPHFLKVEGVGPRRTATPCLGQLEARQDVAPHVDGGPGQKAGGEPRVAAIGQGLTLVHVSAFRGIGGAFGGCLGGVQRVFRGCQVVSGGVRDYLGCAFVADTA
jgi:hypothetical protein